ncbi:hypothetical protein TRFO_06905 [Tritrichomonas foetus]|uniref:Uncharacterized protein n=1 Tax=Tritrichomonas foetus TaxID=1144522 RepID=A0A1J4JVX5_9EUKA|nr:hypothetical protein TRFO_06905 [Tritrichomonas foetus]|eukprot:OHT02866.1 hypothetical protein TRFO_06905 [Tritrichomonas foetus]
MISSGDKERETIKIRLQCYGRNLPEVEQLFSMESGSKIKLPTIKNILLHVADKFSIKTDRSAWRTCVGAKAWICANWPSIKDYLIRAKNENRLFELQRPLKTKKILNSASYPRKSVRNQGLAHFEEKPGLQCMNQDQNSNNKSHVNEQNHGTTSEKPKTHQNMQEVEQNLKILANITKEIHISHNQIIKQVILDDKQLIQKAQLNVAELPSQHNQVPNRNEKDNKVKPVIVEYHPVEQNIYLNSGNLILNYDKAGDEMFGPSMNFDEYELSENPIDYLFNDEAFRDILYNL